MFCVAALPRPKDARPVEAVNPVDPPSHLLRSAYAVFQLETFVAEIPFLVRVSRFEMPVVEEASLNAQPSPQELDALVAL